MPLDSQCLYFSTLQPPPTLYYKVSDSSSLFLSVCARWWYLSGCLLPRAPPGCSAPTLSSQFLRIFLDPFFAQLSHCPRKLSHFRVLFFEPSIAGVTVIPPSAACAFRSHSLSLARRSHPHRSLSPSLFLLPPKRVVALHIVSDGITDCPFTRNIPVSIHSNPPDTYWTRSRSSVFSDVSASRSRRSVPNPRVHLPTVGRVRHVRDPQSFISTGCVSSTPSFTLHAHSCTLFPSPCPLSWNAG